MAEVFFTCRTFPIPPLDDLLGFQMHRMVAKLAGLSDEHAAFSAGGDQRLGYGRVHGKGFLNKKSLHAP